MPDLPDLTRISSGGSRPMLSNKTSHSSLMARATARAWRKGAFIVNYTVDHHGRAR